MKKSISFCEFTDEFRDSQYKDNFSYDGLKALYDYLEQYEEETDTEINLDIVALACDYSEYADLKELQRNYNDIEDFNDLENHTTVIYTKDYQDEDKPFIIQSY